MTEKLSQPKCFLVNVRWPITGRKRSVASRRCYLSLFHLTTIWWHNKFLVIVLIPNRIDLLHAFLLLHTGILSIAKCLKLPDLILSLLWLLKMNIGDTTVFVHNVILCDYVTFTFWVTLELFRRHATISQNVLIFASNTSQLDYQ